jgi:hypothetical protein
VDKLSVLASVTEGQRHMSTSPRPRFGIMTAPSQVDYHDILRVWRDADAIPEIEHAWLFDHLLPIFGDLDGPIYEGWTLLSAREDPRPPRIAAPTPSGHRQNTTVAFRR